VKDPFVLCLQEVLFIDVYLQAEFTISSFPRWPKRYSIFRDWLEVGLTALSICGSHACKRWQKCDWVDLRMHCIIGAECILYCSCSWRSQVRSREGERSSHAWCIRYKAYSSSSLSCLFVCFDWIRLQANSFPR
jgi:hypothetical protein